MEAASQRDSVLAQETVFPVEDAFQASWKYLQNLEKYFVGVSSRNNSTMLFFCRSATL